MMKRLLEGAVRSLENRGPPTRILAGEELRQWMNGLVKAKVDPIQGTASGFARAGMQRVRELANELRRREQRYQRGVSSRVFIDSIADLLIARFAATPLMQIDANCASEFEAAVRGWFAQAAEGRRYYIPVRLIPGPASTVSIGAVSLLHVDALNSHHAAVDLAGREDARTHLDRALHACDAAWLATVEIQHCHPTRSRELSDLAVDVAIGTIQLLFPQELAGDMARCNARARPTHRLDLSTSSGRIHWGGTNQVPAYNLDGSALSQTISAARALLDAAGTCVEQLVTGTNVCPSLRQAWCDACYWFHEGLAEPLDSIATAKLETAIEVLLRSEKTSGSADRMRTAIRVVLGRSSSDPISRESTVTVETFIKSVVSARSRVLHGTSSTLWAEMDFERSGVTALARLLLTRIALAIGGYVREPAPKDDIHALLHWLERRQSPASNPVDLG